MTGDILDDLIARLVLLREQLGSLVFRDAVRRCRQAIARAALAEAEKKSRHAGRNGKETIYQVKTGCYAECEGNENAK
jgi:hypothetical protein